ncbi:MAG TPA: hypothetical protein ENK66_01025, partial [Arcobacter sp.]|nr:hypothetical protein [Arcobacter sp.]
SAFTLIGSGAGNFEIDLNGTITLATGVSLDYETTPIYNLTLTATNDAGTSSAKAVTISVINVAESVPSLTPFSGSLSVSESANNGLNIGTVVYSSDTNITSFAIYNSNNNTLSSEFNISLDGIISVEDNSTFDYDNIKFYNVKIQASNSFGNSAFLPITINITNVANTVPTVDNSSFTINENIPNGTTVGNIVLTSGDAPINSIVLKNRSDNTTSSQFTASITGVITSITNIDYESNASYDLYAVASSSIGSSDEANITININNLRNEVIPVLSSFSESVEENITSGTTIGTITVSNSNDLDSNISAFTLIGSGAGNFEIDLNGTITLATGVSLDYETTPIYNLTLTATNDAGTSSAKAVTISVINVAEIKPTLQAFSGSINEDANNNDIIGTFNFVSGDSNISSFTLYDNDGVTINDEFNITTEGVISVKDNSLLDYETTPSYSLKAIATNDAGDSNKVTVTINVNNISDATPLLANFTTTINENINGGSEIGTLTITDSGDSAISSIVIKNRSDNTISTHFEVTNLGTIKTLPNTTIDYESNSSYTLYAIATNTSGDSPEANITITINDLKNEIVPEIETVSLTVTENSSANTIVGAITITDEGDSNISSFTLSGIQATDFTIDSNGTIKVASGAQIDYEEKTTYQLSTFATNSAGNSATVSITIDVTNIAETPPTLSPFVGSINEDASNGTVIGTLEFESGDSVVTNFTIYDDNPNGASSSSYEPSSSSLSIPSSAQNNLSLYTQYFTKNNKKPTSLTSFLDVLNSEEYYTQMSQTSYDNPSSGMFNKLIAITDQLALNNHVPAILEIQSEFYPEGLLDENSISSQRESIFNLHTQIINNY